MPSEKEVDAALLAMDKYDRVTKGPVIHTRGFAVAALEAAEKARGSSPNADGINLILAEAGVSRSEYLAVKIAVAIESGVYGPLND